VGEENSRSWVNEKYILVGKHQGIPLSICRRRWADDITRLGMCALLEYTEIPKVFFIIATMCSSNDLCSPLLQQCVSIKIPGHTGCLVLEKRDRQRHGRARKELFTHARASRTLQWVSEEWGVKAWTRLNW
jgi:hypothetical protein